MSSSHGYLLVTLKISLFSSDSTIWSRARREGPVKPQKVIDRCIYCEKLIDKTSDIPFKTGLSAEFAEPLSDFCGVVGVSLSSA